MKREWGSRDRRVAFIHDHSAYLQAVAQLQNVIRRDDVACREIPNDFASRVIIMRNGDFESFKIGRRKTNLRSTESIGHQSSSLGRDKLGFDPLIEYRIDFGLRHGLALRTLDQK